MRPLICAMLAVAACSASSAELIERDWLADGDGLLTFDTVNQREWLDVTESLLSRFDGGDNAATLQLALNELERGGLFDGFTLASRNDVLGLLETAGVDANSVNSDEDVAAAIALADLLGETAFDRDVIGVIDEPNSVVFPELEVPKLQFQLRFVSPSISRPNGSRQLTFSSFGDSGLSAVNFAGLMLYRNAVPEPSAFLVACGCATPALTTRRGYG